MLLFESNIAVHWIFSNKTRIYLKEKYVSVVWRAVAWPANDLRPTDWKLVHRCKRGSKRTSRWITVPHVIYASLDIVLQLRRHVRNVSSSINNRTTRSITLVHHDIDSLMHIWIVCLTEFLMKCVFLPTYTFKTPCTKRNFPRYTFENRILFDAQNKIVYRINNINIINNNI